jgi:hypothetical protein
MPRLHSLILGIPFRKISIGRNDTHLRPSKDPLINFNLYANCGKPKDATTDINNFALIMVLPGIFIVIDPAGREQFKEKISTSTEERSEKLFPLYHMRAIRYLKR